MNTTEQQRRRLQFYADLGGRPPKKSMLAKILTFVFGAVLLVLGFMFSVIILAVLAVAGIGFLVWFWWKTRAVREAMKEAATQTQTDIQPEPDLEPEGSGRIIEGEVIERSSERE